MVAINTSKHITVGQSAGKVLLHKCCISDLTKPSYFSTSYPSSFVMPLEHLPDIDSTYMKALESRAQCIVEGGAKEPTPIKDTLFAVQEILTMRGTITLQEREAHDWFYRTFLKFIARENAWGLKRFHTTTTLVLRTGNDTEKPDTVSISDEAFTIVLFKNYHHKWINKHERTLLRGADVTDGMDMQMYGMFTERNIGQSQFSRWTLEGIQKFNSYCNLV